MANDAFTSIIPTIAIGLGPSKHVLIDRSEIPEEYRTLYVLSVTSLEIHRSQYYAVFTSEKRTRNDVILATSICSFRLSPLHPP